MRVFFDYGGVFSKLAERRKNHPIFARAKKNRRTGEPIGGREEREMKDVGNDIKVRF